MRDVMLPAQKGFGSVLRTFAVLAVVTYLTGTGAAAGGPQLENGVYALLKEAPSREAARVEGASHLVLPHDPTKYTGQPQTQALTYLALDTASFVPLVLEKPPEARKDDRGWTMLNVTLAREHVKTLEDLTRTHLGGRVAVVLDGEVVTVHKVRSVITEGEVTITRCEDNACEVLRRKLTN
jgi:hypothetical protein